MNSKKTLTLNTLLNLLNPHKRDLIIGTLAMMVYVLCWPILAQLAGKLIPAIGDGNLKIVINVILISLLVFLIQKFAQFFQDILFARPSLSISKSLRTILFRKIQKIDLISIEKMSTGDITYRLTEDADRVGEIIYKTIQDTLPSFLQLIAVIFYMFYLDIKLTLSTLILAPVIILLISKFGEKVMMNSEISQEKVSNLAGLIGESIQGLPLIKAYAVEDWLQEKFNLQVENHRKSRYKTLKLLAFQHPIVGFIEAFGILSIMAIGALRIQNGGLDAQEFSSFFAGLLMLIDPISHLTTNFNEFQQGLASFKRLREIENESEEYLNSSITSINDNLKGKIELKNISFKYENDRDIINNFSLNIQKNEVIAIVGPSGAGKSTIFSLLLGFLTPQKGELLYDDKNILNYNTKVLRSQIGYVPQNINFMSGTIYESIRFGREFTNSDIVKSAKIANAHEFIASLSNGYDTFLQERGTNLSGGQLQRISIARALLGDPAILLLDEATSALDAEAEKEVQLALKKAFLSRTVIIIAHRLSTVQEADRIVFVDKGKVIETGTHIDLINKSGRYSDLCDKQFIKGRT